MLKKFTVMGLCCAALVLGSCSLLSDGEILSSERSSSSASVVKNESFNYQAVTTCNPLKGFANWGTSNKSNFPCSLSYLPVKFNKVVSDRGVYDFSYLENELKNYEKKGVQAIIRFVIEEPGSGIFLPDSILNKLNKGLISYVRDGVSGKTPNYSDEYLNKVINEFIVAFGKKYDGDARIACVQTGLIGHWGEWHTYYCEKAGIDAMPTKDQQRKIVDTFASAFSKTCVVIRRPNIPGMDTNSKIGIYNDMFYSDSDDTYMNELFDIANIWSRWKSGMITGEFAPGLQNKFVDNVEDQSYEDKFYRRLKLYHNSSLLMSHLFNDYDSSSLSKAKKDKLISLSNALGYDLFVKEASIKKDGSHYKLYVTIENKGMAPFYYDWPVSVAVYNSGIKSEAKTDWKISKISSGSKKTFSYDLGKKYSSSDKILLRIKNPMENGYPVRFSNTRQDRHVNGYLTLF